MGTQTLKVTFKSVGNVNRSNRSNSIGAINMPILSLGAITMGVLGAIHTGGEGGHPHCGGHLRESRRPS